MLLQQHHQGIEPTSFISQEYITLRGKLPYRDRNQHFASAVLPQNLCKNRYNNILAAEHTRVKLRSSTDGYDYINANYVSSPVNPNHFIGCQAPTPGTFASFWHMIWEQDTSVILMLTQLEEGGYKKADKYWPDCGYPVVFDGIEVSYVGRKVIPGESKVIVREFILCHTAFNSYKKVSQIQYYGWPDHGTPETPADMLLLVNLAQHLQGENKSPMVVHCSAGVGRTGTFMAVYNCILLLRRDGRCVISEVVDLIRHQRVGSVTRVSQYEFIYKAVIYVIHLHKMKNS
eukprot:TRINITY_DN11891_c0_g1_i1.p1 TRINITY_DN11891_c0_g1~~TRINITY_DN11891_c0_g1_i1.p1  ORF type:complete len:288 (+),score=20.72 TRINITY_DN11891_c0_g1_i1:33-896(+)